MEPCEHSFGIIPLRFSDQTWNLFLILQKNGYCWGFPKGHAEKGEDSLKAAVRELLEETNLKVERLLQEEPITSSYIYQKMGKSISKVVDYFPAIVSGAVLLQPQEIEDGKWVTFEEAYKLLTFDEAKGVCIQVEEIYCR